MPRRKDLPCGECGTLMVRYKRDRPDSEARCQQCRDTAKPPKPRVYCKHCGVRVQAKLPQGEARCLACRQIVNRKRPDVHCSDCGKWVRYGDSPDDNKPSRCHPCRRLRRTVWESTCDQCGVQFKRKQPGRFCSRQCVASYNSKWMQVRALDDHRVKRTNREHAAPGLRKTARNNLRNKWKRQQKPCAYGGARADTIDHVLPLVRGGTNYEGNLVPACRRCNSSKSGKTIVEWRYGVSLGQVRHAPEWLGKPPVARTRKAPRPARPLKQCPMCGRPATRLKYCSQDCAIERERRYSRDKWRVKNGLPVDPLRPTSRWAKK